MPSLFDMDYGTVRKGTARLSGSEAPRETPSLWDYINAVSMTPVPGVSDVAAGLLAAKDFREGNYGSGALNAAGLIPFVPALGGIFKGVKGATKAEKQALLKAQQMAREGADRDEIWNATLWYKGKDGKWRTEISDEAMQYRPGKAAAEAIAKSDDIVAQYDDALYLRNYMEREGKSVGDAKDWFRSTFGREPHKFAGQHAKALPVDQLKVEAERAIPTMQNVAVKIGDVVEHPELKAAYPSLFDEQWYVAKPTDLGPGTRGMYDPLRGIGMDYHTAYGLQSGKNVTAHEMQHAVDMQEGMARGGSPEMMAAEEWNIPEDLRLARRIVDWSQQFPPERIDKLLETFDPNIAKTAKTMVNKLGPDTVTRIYDEGLNANANEGYKRLLGEVNANNAANRLDMTLDQRRQFPPWSTWDVPEADQIVRFGDGPAMSNGPTNWELVKNWKGADTPDEFYYHVTSQPNAERILQEGLLPGKKPIAGRGGGYAAHSKGKAFLTDAPGVNFWQERIENHLFDQFDNPPAVSIVRIPKSVVGDLPIDEIGTSDARAKAFIANKKLAGLLPYAIPAGLLGMFLTRPGEGYE